MRVAWLVMFLVALGLGVLAGPAGYIFILDASNSMNDPWAGGKTKFAWAQEALIQTIQALAEDTSFGLVVFGHRYAEPKEKSCADIELLFPFRTYSFAERAALISRIQELKARGWTPLAESLRFAAAAVPAGTRLILLTDGEETCGGDPKAVVADLCQKGYVLDVVGVALEAQAQEALRALAETCGGKFVLAAEPTALPGILIEIAVPAPQIPECLAKYRVDPKIVALLLEHLPYPACDPMWDVILTFLSANPPANIIVGTPGDDILFGTPENDLILGLDGNDKIFGFEGNDLLIGGPGDDLIQGGPGCDLILGGPGNDLLFGGPADDILYGEEGDDRLEGEAGNDLLFGGPGCDILLGGPGCNKLDGGPGQNFLYDEGICQPCPLPALPQTTVKPAPMVYPTKTVEEGKSILLRAQVEDPDRDPVKVTWRAPKGFFSDPHALETLYYAPLVADCAGEFIPITVVAEDACGAKAEDTIWIHVLNVNSPPAVDAGPDLAVDEGGKVRLSGWACDPDGDPISVTWIVPCGRGSLDDPHSLTPIFTAPLTQKCEGEVVELVLLVRDICGAESRDTVRIFVRNVNRPPVADAGPDLTVPECGQIMILGRAWDPDGDPIQIFWTVTAGKLLGADTPCPVFIAPEVDGCEPLKVVATMRVVDACGAVAEDQVVITVLNVNQPPRVKADP